MAEQNFYITKTKKYFLIKIINKILINISTNKKAPSKCMQAAVPLASIPVIEIKIIRLRSYVTIKQDLKKTTKKIKICSWMRIKLRIIGTKYKWNRNLIKLRNLIMKISILFRMTSKMMIISSNKRCGIINSMQTLLLSFI